MKRAPLLAVAAIAAAAVIATAYGMTRSATSPEPVIAPQGAALPRPPGATLEITYIAGGPRLSHRTRSLRGARPRR